MIDLKKINDIRVCYPLCWQEQKHIGGKTFARCGRVVAQSVFASFHESRSKSIVRFRDKKLSKQKHPSRANRSQLGCSIKVGWEWVEPVDLDPTKYKVFLLP